MFCFSCSLIVSNMYLIDNLVLTGWITHHIMYSEIKKYIYGSINNVFKTDFKGKDKVFGNIFYIKTKSLVLELIYEKLLIIWINV